MKFWSKVCAFVDLTTKMLPESPELSPERGELSRNRGFWDLRGVQWRTDLGVLPSNSSVDDIRRVTANTRRRYMFCLFSLIKFDLLLKCLCFGFGFGFQLCSFKEEASD